ncbi:hypothetical protein QQP08_001008 [Theobroma cacao]|nr:hypothetical protein QQP08_001008 [Theobroma cacao]
MWLLLWIAVEVTTCFLNLFLRGIFVRADTFYRYDDEMRRFPSKGNGCGGCQKFNKDLKLEV